MYQSSNSIHCAAIVAWIHSLLVAIAVPFSLLITGETSSIFFPSISDICYRACLNKIVNSYLVCRYPLSQLVGGVDTIFNPFFPGPYQRSKHP
nr:unnamed protein product [Callosobruchus chinensis]